MTTACENSDQTQARRNKGRRVGFIGFGGNIVLAGIKLAIGLLTNSIAVMADGFNNLADSLASLITLAGFQLSGKAKDEKHPYGYGRMEYVSGFVVALIILGTAFSLGKAAMARLFESARVEASWPFLLVLLASVIMKLGLAWYTWRTNKNLNSPTLRAAVKDDLADAVVTAVTLLSLTIAPCTALPLDGLAALLVVALIFSSGLSSLWENLDFLLGKGPDDELTKQVVSTVLAHSVFSGVESFELHDYGPEVRLATLRVVLHDDANRREAEQAMQEITETLRGQFHIEAQLYLGTAVSVSAFEKETASLELVENTMTTESDAEERTSSSGERRPAFMQRRGHARAHEHMLEVMLMLHARHPRRGVFNFCR